MADSEYMDELDSAANMPAIISKLPYKLRERWRSTACDVQDKHHRRISFKDVVEFVSRQAKMAMHPVFGDLRD